MFRLWLGMAAAIGFTVSAVFAAESGSDTGTAGAKSASPAAAKAAENPPAQEQPLPNEARPRGPQRSQNIGPRATAEAARVRRFEEMLKSLDTNGDGMLDENELNAGPGRFIVQRVFGQLGIEPKYPIAISDLVRAYENAPQTSSTSGAGASRAPAGRGSSPSAAPIAEATSPPQALTVAKSGTPEHTRLVYTLKNTPAAMINQTVTTVLRAEGELRGADGKSMEQTVGRNVAIVPSITGNSLVITGTPDAVNEVQKLLDELDRRAGSVLVEMEIVEAPTSEVKIAATSSKAEEKSPAAVVSEPFRLLERPPHMETIGRIRLTTMDNQLAFAQIGARVPRVTATTVTAAGTTNAVALEHMGLILKITPRISGDGMIAMQIDAEQSGLGPESEGTPIFTSGDKVVRTPRVETTTLNTTVQIPDGQTVILGSVARQGKSDKELLIIVTPHIIGLGKASKTR